MQPYQQASMAKVHGEESPINLLKNIGLSVGAGAGAKLGSMALNKLAPAIGALISPYVPENLSIAGLKKIDPRFGKLINDALDAGYTYDNFREFMGQKVEEEQQQQQAKQNRNIIEQYSPELHQFISEQIGKGRNAYQAGAIASKDKRFADVIQKITKEHKVPWADILDQIYGQGVAPKKQGVLEQEQDRFNQAYGEQLQPQQQQPGQGNQALMAILQQINQRLGK